jgi:thioesterase domain-containing protein
VPNRLPEELTAIRIGKPIGDRRVYVLDEHMNPVPPGIKGEIYIGGPSVARGYLNRAVLTAERFVMDPFAKEPGVRLYRTGDNARWLADGTLEFIGRNDFQVKIRGFRIELGEIETRLAECDGIREAVVVAREGKTGSMHLVAYYTVNSEEVIEAGQVRSLLVPALPEYMVPAAYVQLESFPLTPNGKLDRNALLPPGEDAYGARSYEPPTGEAETLVSKIWANVLRLDRVGRHDNFFELGGTSLLAVKVANLLEQANASVLAANLFMYPTVESLAKQIGMASKSVQSNAAICFREGTFGPPLFLAPSGIGQLLYVPTLLPHLDSDIPVYGLPPIPLGEATTFTVEAMAARMVRMIREVQPEGPYRIGGWSFGGILAYEIAGQLLGADQKVEFLGLLDTYYSGGGGIRGSSEADIEWDDCKTLLAHIEFYLSIGQRPPVSDQELEAAMHFLRSNVAALDIATFVRKCRDVSLMPKNYSHLTITQVRQTFARERAHLLANSRYYAQPLPIPVQLFIAPGNMLSSREGWSSVVPPGLLDVIETSGNHQSMMKSPHIENVGGAVSFTIRSATKKSRQIPETSYFPLAPLQLGRAKVPPLFCVPGAGANVTGFTELVTCLEKTQPVYGLQPRGLEDGLVPHSTIFAAAECYIRAIHQVCPEEPVHLLGHSFGGWVVFQMAQDLIKSGRTVASLTILDTEVPDNMNRVLREYSNTEAIMKWSDTFEMVLGRPLGLKRAEIDMQPEAVQRTLLHERLVAEGLLPSRTTPDVLQGPLRTFAASLRAHFMPKQAYSGPMRLVLVDELKLDEIGNWRNQQLIMSRWKHWAPNLEYVHGPGNHLTVLKPPHVKILAALLQEELSRTAYRSRQKRAISGVLQ